MLAPLYVKTVYSLLSSCIQIDELITFAKEHHLDSLVITDNQMFGTMEFYKKCKENNIKPIIGLEIKLENDTLLAYAKSYRGYQSLIKLSTLMTDTTPNIEDITKNKEELIFIVPTSSYQTYEILKNEIEEENLYLGYQTLEEENFAKSETKNIVWVKETTYFQEKDKEYLKYLYMIRDGKTINDEVNYKIDGCMKNENFLKMLSELSINNTKKIIDACNLEFPRPELLLPIFPVDNPYEYLVNLSKKGLTKRLDGKVTEEYKDRLLYELDIINKMGFSNYFLVVYDFIRYAKVNGILVGPGRGSAAGSLVSFSLGITDIDPVKYDLLFERFLNPERITMPDIDTDFPDIYRDQIIEYVKEKYGERRVCGIVTFGTLAAKLALRDVARIFNVASYKIDAITKKIPTVTKLKLKDFYEQDSELKELIDHDEVLKKVYEIAQRIEGFPRHTSSHAAGIVMSKIDLDEVIPLTKNDDMYLTGYTMEHLEELGLLKMDFLGLKNLTTIMNVLEDIEKGENIRLSFKDIPLQDDAALKLFQEGDTTGIFQFESSGMKNFLRGLHPNSFEDIFAAIALFRPGPASNIDTFIKRKEGKEKVTYLDPSLEKVLKNTYGIIIYQEQIMQVSQIFAGYTLGEADILRRAMSKKKYDVLKKEEERFIARSIEKGHTKEKAKEVYDLILNFANYGFNRSHSVAYSIIAFKMAYLKAHFPKYFYANLLSSVIGVESKTREYIAELRTKGVRILKPDINKSTEKYETEKDGIRFPLSNIKNIGSVACREIIMQREEGYQDIYDFLKKTTPRVINKKVLESLIDSDCLSSFGYNHKTLYRNLDAIINYANLTKELDEDFVLKPEIIVEEEFEKEVLIQKEKELFGLYLTNHPVTKHKEMNNIFLQLDEISKYFGMQITFVALVEKVKKIMTKKQEEMAFVDISDEYAKVDLTIFPKLLSKIPPIKVGDILKITGRIEKRYNTFQIIAENIEILNSKK